MNDNSWLDRINESNKEFKEDYRHRQNLKLRNKEISKNKEIEQEKLKFEKAKERNNWKRAIITWSLSSIAIIISIIALIISLKSK